jgi:hypothetical protein
MKYYHRFDNGDFIEMSERENDNFHIPWNHPFCITFYVISIIIILGILLGAYIEYGTLGEIPLD